MKGARVRRVQSSHSLCVIAHPSHVDVMCRYHPEPNQSKFLRTVLSCYDLTVALSKTKFKTKYVNILYASYMRSAMLPDSGCRHRLVAPHLLDESE